MPAALDVDREQVRMLVLSVGVAEASRRTGIDLSTVKQWSARGKWLEQFRRKQTLPTSMQSRVTDVTVPGDALETLLLERRDRTKLAQSNYLARASEKLEQVKESELLEHAPIGKTLAEMASKVYPEVAVDQSTHLSFFSVAMERPGSAEEGAIDLPDLPDVTSDPDPLEGY